MTAMDDETGGLMERLNQQEEAVVNDLKTTYELYCNNPPQLIGPQDSYTEDKLSEATRQLIINEEDDLMFDDAKNFVEYLDLLRTEILATEERIAFKRANIQKMEAEIAFYQKKTSSIKEAMREHTSLKELPASEKFAQEKEELHAKFRLLKTNMYHVINTLYPDNEREIKKFLTAICKAHIDSGGYVEAGSEHCIQLLEALQAAHIIVQHPHDHKMFKLAF